MYRSNIEFIMGADGVLKTEDGTSIFIENVFGEESRELSVPPPPPAPATSRERASLTPGLSSSHKKMQGWGPSPLRLLLG